MLESVTLSIGRKIGAMRSGCRSGSAGILDNSIAYASSSCLSSSGWPFLMVECMFSAGRLGWSADTVMASGAWPKANTPDPQQNRSKWTNRCPPSLFPPRLLAPPVVVLAFARRGAKVGIVRNRRRTMEQMNFEKIGLRSAFEAASPVPTTSYPVTRRKAFPCHEPCTNSAPLWSIPPNCTLMPTCRA